MCVLIVNINNQDVFYQKAREDFKIALGKCPLKALILPPLQCLLCSCSVSVQYGGWCFVTFYQNHLEIKHRFLGSYLAFLI